MKTIYFPQENDRTFYIPLVLLTFVEGQETQTPIEASSLTEVKFQYGQGSRLQEREHRVNDNYIIVEFPAGTLKTNEKVDFHLTGKRDGVKFAKHIYEAACPVPFDHMANEKDFILGQPTILPTQILISANEMTDEELEQLKEQYREKVQDLEEAIEDYEEKLHTLEGIAKETTVTSKAAAIEQKIDNGVQTINSNVDYKAASIEQEINNINPAHPSDIATLEEHIIAIVRSLKNDLRGTNAEATLTAILAAFGTIDFSTLAKQGTNPDATNTAILAAFGNIDFSSLAKQGTDTTATNTAILNAIQNIDFSALAKQGENQSISLTTIDGKIENQYASDQDAIDAIEEYLTPFIPIN